MSSKYEISFQGVILELSEQIFSKNYTHQVEVPNEIVRHPVQLSAELAKQARDLLLLDISNQVTCAAVGVRSGDLSVPVLKKLKFSNWHPEINNLTAVTL